MSNKKTYTRNKPDGKSQEALYMVFALLILLIGTIFHENIHAIISWLNGWGSETSVSLITGKTTAITSATNIAQIPTASLWLFYMVPSLAIFAITTALVIIQQDKIILILVAITQFLNLASVEPGITGSDANSAVQLLITRGWTEAAAYGLHYVIGIMCAIVFVWVLYIAIENNPKDARARVKGGF